MSDETKPTYLAVSAFQPVYGVGRLGATSDRSELVTGAQLDMIERRILRLEMLLRRAGIEPESIELPL